MVTKRGTRDMFALRTHELGGLERFLRSRAKGRVRREVDVCIAAGQRRIMGAVPFRLAT